MRKELSRAGRFALAISFLVAVASVAIPRFFPAPHASAASVSTLHEEREKLGSNTEALRDTLRQQLTAHVGPPWNEPRLAELQRRLGPGWGWPEGPAHHCLIVALAPEHCRWDTLLAAVERIEREPGLVIERLDLAAAGNGPARHFTRVVITARILRPRARTRSNPARAAALSARARLAGSAAERPGKVARFRLRCLRATLPALAALATTQFPTQRTP